MVELRQWLAMLAKLTAPRDPAEAARAFAAYAPLLSERFPAEVYTQASLEAVAEKCRFVPTYGEIVEHLAAWWRDNRPASQKFPALPAPEAKPKRDPTAEEVAAVEAIVQGWRSEVAEREAVRPKRHAEEIRPYYLQGDVLRKAYLAEGLDVPLCLRSIE